MTQPGRTWKIRDGGERDLEQILSLRKIVFGEMEKDKLDPRFWEWEFLKGPEGRAFIYIAEDGGKVIGHFADLPRSFSVNGKTVPGTLSIDLMVHPDYRREGIFAEMGRYAAERVRSKNGLFMTAFPIRPPTINGFKKLGWRVVSELPVLVYPIRFSAIVKRYLKFSALSLLVGGVARSFYLLLFGGRRKKEAGEIEISEVVDLDEGFDQFWQKALSLYPIMGLRDRAFLRWRYLQHPTRTYTIYRALEKGEMRGYLILRKVDLLHFNSAIIVDLLALDEKALSALLEEGIDRSRREGADLLGFMVPKRHPYYRRLRQQGFLSSQKTFLLMVYSHSGEEIPFVPEAWYVNWGDTDVL